MKYKKSKKKLLTYVDDSGLYYLISGDDSDVHGKFLFTLDEKEAPNLKFKHIKTELKSIVSQVKVKELVYVISSGIRMVKVFKFDKDLKLNNDTELILKEEVLKYLQPSENINEYGIYYVRMDKKQQNTFLTAVVKKKSINEICMLALQDKLPLVAIKVPEEIMYAKLKDKIGVNAVALYDATSMYLRVLVVNNSEYLYATQSSNVYPSDVYSELDSMLSHVKDKYRLNVLTTDIYGLSGDFISEDERFVNLETIVNDTTDIDIVVQKESKIELLRC